MQTTWLERGTVSGRVALLLRSAEIQPLFIDLSDWIHQSNPPHHSSNARPQLQGGLALWAWLPWCWKQPSLEQSDWMVDETPLHASRLPLDASLPRAPAASTGRLRLLAFRCSLNRPVGNRPIEMLANKSLSIPLPGHSSEASLVGQWPDTANIVALLHTATRWRLAAVQWAPATGWLHYGLGRGCTRLTRWRLAAAQWPQLQVGFLVGLGEPKGVRCAYAR